MHILCTIHLHLGSGGIASGMEPGMPKSVRRRQFSPNRRISIVEMHLWIESPPLARSGRPLGLDFERAMAILELSRACLEKVSFAFARLFRHTKIEQSAALSKRWPCRPNHALPRRGAAA